MQFGKERHHVSDTNKMNFAAFMKMKSIKDTKPYATKTAITHASFLTLIVKLEKSATYDMQNELP